MAVSAEDGEAINISVTAEVWRSAQERCEERKRGNDWDRKIESVLRNNEALEEDKNTKGYVYIYFPQAPRDLSENLDGKERGGWCLASRPRLPLFKTDLSHLPKMRMASFRLKTSRL